ncbi:MAG: hypothetical protein WCF18_16475 [Chthoniobacteraceae bacterium]
MSESSPNVSAPAIYAQPWAVRLGFALITAFTVIVGLAFFDSAHRTELETTSETTALGDTHFFQSPADASRLPAVGAMLNSQPLYVADMKPIEVRDTRTRRIGSDPERGLAIYELSATASDAERARLAGNGRAFLLKTAPSQYVIARSAAGK